MPAYEVRCGGPEFNADLDAGVGPVSMPMSSYAREDAFYTMPASAASTFDIAAHDSAFDDLESDLIHFSSFELDGRGHV